METADKKPSKNMTINPVLVKAAETYIAPRHNNFTRFVEEAMEEKLRALGIDPFVPDEAVATEPPPQKLTTRKPAAKRKIAHIQLRDILSVSLSVLSSIPAGWPEERVAVKAKREVKVAKGRFPEGAFGLDVMGDSMNAATGRYGPVLDGETVVLLAPDRREPKHGDIVAALCDGRTTLKRLWCKPQPCVLRAESDSLEWKNCIRPAHDLVIQGVVIGKL